MTWYVDLGGHWWTLVDIVNMTLLFEKASLIELYCFVYVGYRNSLKFNSLI